MEGGLLTDRRKYTAFMEYCSSYLFADPTLEQEHAFYAGWNLRERLAEEEERALDELLEQAQGPVELPPVEPEDVPHALLLIGLLALLAALLAAAISRA